MNKSDWEKIVNDALDKAMEESLESTIAHWESFKSVKKHGEKTGFRTLPGPRLLVKTPDGAWILS